MDPVTRIKIIMLIERIKKNPEYADRITVENVSYFRKKNSK